MFLEWTSRSDCVYKIWLLVLNNLYFLVWTQAGTKSLSKLTILEMYF